MRAVNGRSLLSLDPALGAFIAEGELEQAQRLRFPTLQLDAGGHDASELRRHPDVKGRILGLYVERGLLVTDLSMDGRVCSQLTYAGDVLIFDGTDDDALPMSIELRAAQITDAVVLDDRFLVACRHFPRLLTGVLDRLAVQERRAHRSRAISQLPRIEQRILGLLWTIAEHQGLVRPDGVHVDLLLTHSLIGQLVGAQRPTVSLGLTKLVEQGVLSPLGRGWLIDPDSAAAFEPGPAKRRDDRSGRPQAASVDDGDDRPEPAAPASGGPPEPEATPSMLMLSSNPAAAPAFMSGAMTTTDEGAAVRALAATVPDLVVVELDAVSPHGRGERLADRLRDDRALRFTRVLVVNTDGLVPTRLLAAAHEYLDGPVGATVLRDRVTAQLAIAAAGREHREAPNAA